MGSWGGLGALLRPVLEVLGHPWGLCWRSCAALGANVGDLEPLLGLGGRSWAALGVNVGGLGPLLGSMLAVLERLGRLGVA